MEDNDKNMEEFFRKKYNKNVQQEAWNTPDESVWHNIQTQLQPTKKSPKWLFLLFALLTLGSIALALHFRISTKLQQEKIQTLEKQLQSCTEGRISTSDVNHQNISAGNTPLETQMMTNNEQNYTTFSLKQANKKSTPPSETPIFPNVPFSSLLSDSMKLATNQSPAQQSSIPSITENTLNITSTLPALQPLPTQNPMTVSFNKNAQNFKKAPTTPVIKPAKPLRFLQLGLYSDLVFWQKRSTGSLEIPLAELLTQEDYAGSVGYSLRAKMGINKHFTFNTGIGYYTRTLRSQYALNLPYNQSTEHLGSDGNLENEFSHSLPTALGNVNTNLTLNRAPSSTIAPIEPVALDFAFQRTAQMLLIPMHFSYYPNAVGKGLFFSLGVNACIDFNYDIKGIQTISKHSTIHEKNIAVTDGISARNNFNLQAAAEVGYQLPLASGWNIDCSLEYARTLIKTYSINNYKHSFDQPALRLGISRKF